MAKQKTTNSSKDVYDDDNIPEIDLPKKNSHISKSSCSVNNESNKEGK